MVPAAASHRLAKPWILIPLSILIGGLFGFLILEVGLRVRAKILYGQQMPIISEVFYVDPATGLRVPRPGYHLKGNRIEISINSLGFRGAEFTREKPPGTVRIACIGASTTMSEEASSDSTTWPARLEQYLRDSYPNQRIEVVNAGVPGYVLKTTLKSLELRVLPLDPDIVVFYEANNDMAEDTKRLAVAQGLITKGTGGHSHWLTVAARKSMLIDYCYKNFYIVTRGGLQAKPKHLQSLPPDLPKRYVGLLAQMNDLLKARNVDLVLSTYLVKYRREQPREEQIRNADVAFFFMPWMTVDLLLDGMDLYNAAIVDFARSNDVSVVTDRTSIPGESEYFVDCMHFTDRGHQMMAERVFKHFMAEGLVDSVLARRRAAGQPAS